jgi:hypothetical protein
MACTSNTKISPVGGNGGGNSTGGKGGPGDTGGNQGPAPDAGFGFNVPDGSAGGSGGAPGTPCTNLCTRKVTCPSGTTSLSGTVLAPTPPRFGKPDPIYNASSTSPTGRSSRSRRG